MGAAHGIVKNEKTAGKALTPAAATDPTPTSSSGPDVARRTSVAERLTKPPPPAKAAKPSKRTRHPSTRAIWSAREKKAKEVSAQPKAARATGTKWKQVDKTVLSAKEKLKLRGYTKFAGGRCFCWEKRIWAGCSQCKRKATPSTGWKPKSNFKPPPRDREAYLVWKVYLETASADVIARFPSP